MLWRLLRRYCNSCRLPVISITRRCCTHTRCCFNLVWHGKGHKNITIILSKNSLCDLLCLIGINRSSSWIWCFTKRSVINATSVCGVLKGKIKTKNDLYKKQQDLDVLYISMFLYSNAEEWLTCCVVVTICWYGISCGTPSWVVTIT